MSSSIVRSTPLCDITPMQWGNKPTDNGNFLLTPEEKDELLSKEPLATKWIRPYIGAEEFINNKKRYCLWLVDISPNELNALPLVKARVESVRQFRLASVAESTRQHAEYPTFFRQIAQKEFNTTLFTIPITSSENRDYIPMGYVEQNSIFSNACYLMHNTPKWLFAILTSRMHMAWMRTVCGRLKGDYRYSKDIVYNNFPFLNLDDTQKGQLMELADAILMARSVYPDSSLADLYNPTTMPPSLRKAHTKLDNYVDKLYNKKSFESDSERVAMLLLKYKTLIEEDGLYKTEVVKVRKKRVKKD